MVSVIESPFFPAYLKILQGADSAVCPGPETSACRSANPLKEQSGVLNVKLKKDFSLITSIKQDKICEAVSFRGANRTISHLRMELVPLLPVKVNQLLTVHI